MKLRGLILISVLYFLTPLNGQDFKYMDSIRKKLPTLSDSDTNKVRFLNSLAFEYSYVDLDSGLVIAKNALLLAEKQKYIRGIAFSYNVMGSIYYDKADYKMAIDCFTKGKKIAEDLNDYGILMPIYGNTALTDIALQDFASARHYLFETLRIFRKLGHPEQFHFSYLSIGNFYLGREMYDSALIYFDSTSLAIPSKDPIDKISLLGAKANCYFGLKQYEKAEKQYEAVIKLAKEINSDYYYALTLSEIGNLYLETKRYGEAETSLLESLDLFKRIAMTREAINVHESLYQVYSRQNKFEKALYHHEQYASLNDSINNAETNKIARELEKKYEDQKKIAQIEKLNSENKESEAENKRKGQQLIFAIVGCILVFIALGFAIYSFINKRKANIKLQALHKEVSEQKNELFDKNKNITDSILYAQRIQKALLTSRVYIKENTNDFFILHKPKDIVSGDFYWAQRTKDHFFFMLADCTGHGVPGAFMSLLGISYLHELVVGQKLTETDKILNKLRSNIIHALSDNTYEMKDGMDGVLCRFNVDRTKLSYSAGNNTVIVIRDKNIIDLSGDKMPIGRSPRDDQNFTPHEFTLQKNDLIYLFTDGFPDQFGGPKGKKMKQKALKEMLVKWHDLPFDQQEKLLSSYFEEWKNELEQIDDVTLVGFRI